MKMIYVGGPFRSTNANGKSNAWGVQCNVMAAMSLALEVWKLGAVAICPHSNSMFFQDADGVDDQIWLKGDIEILRRCDAMILTPNWTTSKGATAEAVFADANGIPIFHTISDLKNWLQKGE